LSMSEQEQLVKSRKFYLRLLVIGLFAFALLHSINPFFFRFLFWITFGMGAMTLYYHIALKIAERGTHAHFRSQGQRSRWTEPQQQGNTPIQSQVKKAIGIVIAVVFSIFFLLMMIGLFVGEDETTQSSVEDLVRYDEARSLYESQDYRGAIKVLWKDVTNDTPDTQSVLLMGDSYYALQSLDSAYVWYAEAYSRGERTPFLSHVMAYILDERGNTQEAIILYKEAVEMDSTKADVYKRLAELEPENRDWYLAKQRQYSEQ
jgi:tetratricopeptide (TPR) repeat protein